MPTVLIKRYPNRKLYNTATKRYITLDAIAELILEGYDVEVRDHETGEDLTGVTLSQIIFEREKRDTAYLPSALLANLIRTGGRPLNYMRRSFQASVSALRTLEAEIDQRIDALVHRGELAEEEAQRLRAEIRGNHRSDFVDVTTLDRRVEATLHRLNIPSRADLLRLQHQLDRLAEVLDAMLETEAGSAPRPEESEPPAKT